MAFFNTFEDLRSSTAYTTHTVGKYDVNTTTGGGTFRWITANNTGITDIPGFRIKPTATTIGYWERIYDNNVNISWFGTINTSSQGTLASYGFTQAQLNTRYGVVNLVLTTDTYDTAAIKYAFYLMQEVRGFQTLNFEAKDYYINSSCLLPGLFTPRSTSNVIYTINGNGAWIFDHSTLTTAIDYFGSKLPANSTEAANFQRRRFIIKGFLFNGNGTINAGSGKAAICLGESYNSEISSNHFEFFYYAIKARFCMNTKIEHNNCVNCVGDSIFVTFGSDWGGTTANGASNHTSVTKNRIFGNPSSLKGIHVRGASGSVVDGNIWEGDTLGAGTHAVYFDNAGATTVKENTIKSTHVERPHVAGGSFFYVRGTTGMYTIEKPYVQYAGTLVEGVSSVGFPEIKLSGIGYIPNACKLKGGTGVNWILEDNIFPSVYSATTDANIRTNVDGSGGTFWYSGYKSTTSNTIGTGSKSFTIPLNADGYTAGAFVTIEPTSNSNQNMKGTVTSYNAATGALVVNIVTIVGSGTYTDWTMWTNDATPAAIRIIYRGTNLQGGS